MEVDRGYAWVVALCGAGLQVLTAATFSVFSMVYIHMAEHYDASKARTSLVGAIQFFSFGVAALCAGPLIRRYGRRRIGMVAPLISTTGFLLTAFCTQLWQVYITMGVMSGVGFAVYPSVAVSTVYRWFDKKRTLALGIVMVGPAIGSFLWPLFMASMISIFAWKGAMIIAAAVNMQAMVFFALMRPPYSPRRNVGRVDGNETNILASRGSSETKHHDSDVQLNDTFAAPQTVSHVSSTEHIKALPKQKGDPGTHSLFAFLVLFKDPSFWCFFFAEVFIFVGHMVPFTYSTPRGILLGYAEQDSALLSSILGICSGVGRLGAGILGHWLTKNTRLYVCAAAVYTTAAFSVISLASNMYWFLALHAALGGLSIGLYVVFLMGGPQDLYGSLFASELTGINLANLGVATFASNTLAGWLFDNTDNPSLPFAVTGGIQCIGATFVLAAVVIKSRQSHR